jgi:PEP-CTERM motif-containing protein
MPKIITAIALLLASAPVHAAPVTITDALNQHLDQQVSVTIRDCGEIDQGGAFPKWAYLILATPAICFTGICSGDNPITLDNPTLPNTQTKETSQPAPVPEPSSLALLVIGLATLWRRRQSRY